MVVVFDARCIDGCPSRLLGGFISSYEWLVLKGGLGMWVCGVDVRLASDLCLIFSLYFLV